VLAQAEEDKAQPNRNPPPVPDDLTPAAAAE
jgi:hypothetical protein